MNEDKHLKGGHQFPVYKNIAVIEADDSELPDIEDETSWRDFLTKKFIEEEVELIPFEKHIVLASYPFQRGFRKLWVGTLW
jgi:hypothetical protein